MLLATLMAAAAGNQSAGPRTGQPGLVTRMGVRGVGQTSWGPTLFAPLESQSEAEEFAQRLRVSARNEPMNVTIAAPEPGPDEGSGPCPN